MSSYVTLCWDCRKELTEADTVQAPAGWAVVTNGTQAVCRECAMKRPVYGREKKR